MRILIYIFLFTIIVAGCKVTEYPASGNYAYESKIKIKGNYPQKEKNQLEEKLLIQIDDSLRYSRVSKKTSGILGFIKHPVKVYHNFDSSNISRTMDFFKAAYVANGYFRGGKTEYNFDTLPNTNDRAIIINFEVEPFRNHFMDSIGYSIYDSGVNKVVAKNWKETFLKKNDLYAQDMLEQELRRITYDLRNQGYLFFSQGDLKVIADTINTALLKVADPFEEQLLLAEAAEFERNPNTDITIALRDNVDSKKLKQYYIGKLHLHTDNYDKDVTAPNSKLIHNGQIIKYFTQDKYKDSLLTNHIFLEYGNLYAEQNAAKTVQTINNLNVWQQITIEPIEKSIRNDTVDFAIYMQPYLQFQSEVKLEGNYNQAAGSSSALSGPRNLLGFNFFFNLKNRNFNRKGIQATLSTNASTDFGKPQGQVGGQNIFNTIQVGISGNLLYPELKIIKRFNSFEKILVPKAGFNTNISYSERLNFFKLFEYSAGYGSKFGYVAKKNIWDVQFNINLENKLLEKGDSLKARIITNPSLNNIYRDGIIAGLSGAMSNLRIFKENKLKNTSTKISDRLFVEFSGLPSIKANRLFSFIKLEWDRRYYFQNQKKNIWALRHFIGFGKSFNQSQSQNKTLPFFRQFVGGGPSSLRAWTVRGVNSYSTRNSQAAIESFGDIQIETNAEYRHKLFSLVGIPIQGGAFVDMGNIWNHTPTDPTLRPTGKSKSQIILDDIAIAAGYGLRIDFGYFLIRFDLATKLKEPSTITGEGGFLRKTNYDQLNDIKFQLGINMPF